jgi:hypothetical protein
MQAISFIGGEKKLKSYTKVHAPYNQLLTMDTLLLKTYIYNLVHTALTCQQLIAIIYILKQLRTYYLLL